MRRAAERPVAAACLGGLILAMAGCKGGGDDPPPKTPPAIDGTWSATACAEECELLTLMGGTAVFGLYRPNHAVTPGVGLQRFTYTLDAAGAFAITAIKADTTDDWNDFTPATRMTWNLTGPHTAEITSSGQTLTLSRQTASATDALHGTWLAGDPASGAYVVLVFVGGRYLWLQEGPSDGRGQTGIEYGTYAWNVASGDLSISVPAGADTGGGWGFSAAASVVVEVTGTTASIVRDGGAPLTFTRLEEAPPIIRSFEVTRSTITAGESTTLRAEFTGGTGSIDPGVGSVTSGTPVTVAPPATTTYTLTVTGAGMQGTRSAVVTVVPPPSVPVVRAPPNAVAGMGGYVASADALAGSILAWTIAGGTFAGGGTTATGSPVTFTAGHAATLELRCTATNAAGTTSAAGAVTLPVSGFVASYRSMYLNSNIGGWSGVLPLTLTANHQWTGTTGLTLANLAQTPGTLQMKLSTDGAWGTTAGATAWTNPVGTALSGQAHVSAPGEGNIHADLSPTGDGSYLVTFDDQTAAYSLVKR